MAPRLRLPQPPSAPPALPPPRAHPLLPSPTRHPPLPAVQVGITALMYAAQNGHASVVSILIGVSDVNAKSDVSALRPSLGRTCPCVGACVVAAAAFALPR